LDFKSSPAFCSVCTLAYAVRKCPSGPADPVSGSAGQSLQRTAFSAPSQGSTVIRDSSNITQPWLCCQLSLYANPMRSPRAYLGTWCRTAITGRDSWVRHCASAHTIVCERTIQGSGVVQGRTKLIDGAKGQRQCHCALCVLEQQHCDLELGKVNAAHSAVPQGSRLSHLLPEQYAARPGFGTGNWQACAFVRSQQPTATVG